ncbi:MAG: MBL fold metallo-hydrolase [Limnochordia bacterium]|jgi:phosphoribosyl 1,2-cyclic phosphate phosphodiesterase
MIRILFMGTGTSHGVPVIGCNCDVCTSADPRNNRTRSSLLISHGDKNILIDTATELRLQAIRWGVSQVHAVLYTHFHADHVFGFDDLRRFNQLQGQAIPVYGNEITIEELRTCFAYVFRSGQRGGGKPQIVPYIIEGAFTLFQLPIQPIQVLHGRIPILGYRFGDIAYITDCSHIPPSQLPLLENLDILILGALRREPHPTHFNLDQALEAIERIKPRRAWLTHTAHSLEYSQVESQLPPHVHLAYDGLTLTSP